jgi:hypothetical protein
VRSLYFRMFSASFLITFLSPEFATSINIHVLFSFSRIKVSGFVVRYGSVSLNLFIPQYGYVVSLACFYWFWDMFVSVFFCPVVPVSLHMLKCSCAHTLFCLFMYCSFASMGHADIIWSIASSNCWHSLH